MENLEISVVQSGVVQQEAAILFSKYVAPLHV